MTQAQLDEVVCERANFSAADLSYADLSHADLKDADLTNTRLHQAKLHQINDSNTLWDGSSRHLAQGMDSKRLRAEQWKPRPRP